MKIIEEGHFYELEHFNDKEARQFLMFIYKTTEAGKFTTVHDGTTNEEVLDALIDRMLYLNNKMPCFENEMAIDGLRIARSALKARTSNRKARDVEGTDRA